MLKGEVKDVLLLDVTPLSLGIETEGEVDHQAHRAQHDDPDREDPGVLDRVGQPAIGRDHVLQGERPMARDNRILGTFILDGIPPAPRGMPQIEVRFDIDANGILNVSAKDRGTGKENKVTITAGSTTLQKDEVERMVTEAEVHADEDSKRAEEVETRNRADQLAYQAEKTLGDRGDKVSAEDKAEVEREVAAVREALKGSDIAAVRSGMDALTGTLSRVATAAYARSASSDGSNGTDGTGGGSDGSDGAGGTGEGEPAGAGTRAGGSDGAPDETVEGEFKEV